jgi:ubiquitin C-terminal hydrolase
VCVYVGGYIYVCMCLSVCICVRVCSLINVYFLVQLFIRLFIHSFINRVETLSGVNAYDCEKCKTKTTAEKNASLLNVPSVLTVQLKRFSQKSYDNGEIVKLDHLVDYPSTLFLEPYLSEVEKKVVGESDGEYYQRIDQRSKEGELTLCGVIVHIGCTISNGHYVAYVRCSTNKKVEARFYL